MTAKGKINASNVQTGDRIIVRRLTAVSLKGETYSAFGPSDTKTGEGVSVARVVSKRFRAAQRYESRGKYVIETTAGTFEAAPIQTMWLTPEDAPGIKRAHVEALAEDNTRVMLAVMAQDPELDQDEVENDHAEALAEDAARTLSETNAKIMAETVQTEVDEAHAVALVIDADREFIAQNRAWMDRHGIVDGWGMRHAEQADHAEAVREDWCRRQVELAGKSWSTHMTKFDGTVLPRELTLHSQAGKVNHISEEDRTEEPEMTSKAMHEAKALKTATQIRENAAKKHTGSTVVALIEKVWDRIREDHPELPEVVVTTGSGEGVKWGHFRPESWKLAETEGRRHEFFLSSEALAKGSVQVLQTTIHEATHTLNRVRGNKDTSRQGRYHNAQFRKTAEELGLEHPNAQADSTHGFSFVKLSEATKAKHADLLAELDKELVLTGILPLWLGGSADGEDEQGGEKITGKPAGGETKAQSGNLRAICECDEPNIIRASKKILDLGVIRCDDCRALFTEAPAK